jgi:hypothetical protein
LTIHILAAVAQHEREIISARTSAALKAKRNDRPELVKALATCPLCWKSARSSSLLPAIGLTGSSFRMR